MKGKITFKGGPGSGNFGHLGRPGRNGRPGRVGGSSQRLPGRPGGESARKPDKKKRITIQQAARMLQEMGYKLGRGRTDLKLKKTFYQVTTPNGEVQEMSTDDIIKLI